MEVLGLIRSLAQKGYYYLTDHAVKRRIERRLSISDVEDILINPQKIIRVDVTENNKKKYKIKGGSKNRTLALVIEIDYIIVVTVM